LREQERKYKWGSKKAKRWLVAFCWGDRDGASSGKRGVLPKLILSTGQNNRKNHLEKWG